jgi:hypothetical protein
MTELIFVKLQYLIPGREKVFHSLSVHIGCGIKLTSTQAMPRATFTEVQRPESETNRPNFWQIRISTFSRFSTFEQIAGLESSDAEDWDAF